MILASLLLALTVAIGSGPVEPVTLPRPATGASFAGGASDAGRVFDAPPVKDLRAEPFGRLWLERYVGGTSWESFGEGGIQAFSTVAYRRDAARAARAAARALPEIARSLGLSTQDLLPFWILVSPHAEGFAREAPTWSAAIAVPEKRLIVLSGPSLRRTVLDLEETVAHEIAHLALRARIGEMGWVPRWFDEGLAMRLAGYDRLRDRLSGIGRGRLDLRELADEFPRDADLARQAYVESEAAVRRIEERGPLAPLLDRLAAEEDFEPAFAAVYGQSFDDFADQISGEVPRLWRFLVTARGTTLLWAFGAALVVLGAWRVRLRNRRRSREWETAEAAARAGASPPTDGAGASLPTDGAAASPPATTAEPPREGQEDPDIRSI